MKKTIKALLNKFGYKICKTSTDINYSNTNDIRKGLARCQQRNIDVNTVIDVGASNGLWSEICMANYPKSKYYLIEAQKEHENSLNSFKLKHSNVDFKIVAAGNREGFILFDNTDLFGGLALDEETPDRNLITVPVTTIDVEVLNNSLKPPFLIKLDTHGYEIPILEGAAETLKLANIVIIEVYNFVIADKSLRFWEMCQYMEKLGFLPIDLVDVLHTKKDNSLWQFDLIFVKNNRVEFENPNYG